MYVMSNAEETEKLKQMLLQNDLFNFCVQRLSKLQLVKKLKGDSIIIQNLRGVVDFVPAKL